MFADDDSSALVDWIIEFVLEPIDVKLVDVLGSLLDVGDELFKFASGCGVVYRVMIVASSFAAAN